MMCQCTMTQKEDRHPPLPGSGVSGSALRHTRGVLGGVTHSPLAEAAEIAIAVSTGAEVIAGSTRMKGGLAQKMILHLLSTTVMVRLGYVEGNLMTHMIPGSQKLRERAIGILESMTDLNAERAARLLDECGGSVAAALASLKRGESR